MGHYWSTIHDHRNKCSGIECNCEKLQISYRKPTLLEAINPGTMSEINSRAGAVLADHFSGLYVVINGRDDFQHVSDRLEGRYDPLKGYKLVCTFFTDYFACFGWHYSVSSDFQKKDPVMFADMNYKGKYKGHIKCHLKDLEFMKILATSTYRGRNYTLSGTISRHKKLETISVQYLKQFRRNIILGAEVTHYAATELYPSLKVVCKFHSDQVDFVTCIPDVKNANVLEFSYYRKLNSYLSIGAKVETKFVDDNIKGHVGYLLWYPLDKGQYIKIKESVDENFNVYSTMEWRINPVTFYFSASLDYRLGFGLSIN